MPYIVWALLKLALTNNFSWASVTTIVTEPVSFWFLWVLFWVYLFFQFSLYCHQNTKAKFNYTSIAFALALIAVIAVLSTKLFAFHLIAYYFSFYAMVYYMGQLNLLKVTSKWFLGILAVVWFFLAMGWSMHSLPGWMPAIPYVPSSVVQLAYRFMTAFIAIVVLLNLAPRGLSSDGKANEAIAKLGFYSLGIYVTHYLMIWYLSDKICQWGLFNRCIEIVLIFVLGCITSFLLVWLLNRNKITAKLFLGKLG